MRRLALTIIVGILACAGGPARADQDDAAGFAPTLDGQLERLSAELPCPLDDDLWKATPSRRPPDRPSCPWTAATEAQTRKFWRAAALNAKYLRLEEAQSNPARYAGRPYVVTGVVREATYDLMYRLQLLLETEGGGRVQVLVEESFPVYRPGTAVEVVGYLADDGGVAALAAAGVGIPGEVDRLIEMWSRPIPPPALKRRWLFLNRFTGGGEKEDQKRFLRRSSRLIPSP